ncbi:hypothetical protein C8Q80DRAFT_1267030 [Daedaleopsis nitida]|nr:hypothetical protein C8Q80DRAFT_1267030 [Daedaleopsis nitida]
MTLLRLNFDVFHEIASYLPQGSRNYLMRTCRALHRSPEADKIILGGYIMLRSAQKFASFVAFLDAEEKRRCQYVREIWLYPDYNTFPRQALLAFSRCIPRLASLNSMKLHEAELMFAICPEFGEAFAKLTSLRNVDLFDVGPVTCVVLQALESELASIRMRWLIDMDEEFLVSDENHPVQRLVNLSSSLESLSCEN